MRRLALVLLASVVVPGAAAAQDAATFYEENCAVCHTIGRGSQAGPDLKGSTDRRDRGWLVRFLLDPEKMVNSGDEYAVKLVAKWDGVVMPAADGLSRELAEALVEYIEQQSREGAAPAAPAAIAFTEADRVRGLDIFTGRARLTGGGPACVSCHALGGFAQMRGGLMGPELGAAYTRLGGAAGTTAWLARPPTPVMRAIYRRSILNDDEVRSIAAVLEASTSQPLAPASSIRTSLALAGAAGAIGALVVIGVIFRGRFSTVRRRLTDHSAQRIAR